MLFQNPTTVQAQIYWNSTTGALVFQNVFGTGGQMYVDSTGSLYTTVQAYKPGGGAWIASSDARIKDVTGDYTAGLEQVLRLRPVTYRYRGNDAAAGETSPHAATLERAFIGLVAQDAEQPMPEMVTLGSGFVDGSAVDDLRSLDTGPLLFALVNAVRELAERVAAMEA